MDAVVAQRALKGQDLVLLQQATVQEVAAGNLETVMTERMDETEKGKSHQAGGIGIEVTEKGGQGLGTVLEDIKLSFFFHCCKMHLIESAQMKDCC